MAVDKDLLDALVDCSAVLQRAHRIAEPNHPYVAQLIRIAAWKIGAAIAQLSHVAAEAEAS